MAKFLSKDVRVLIGGYDVSASLVSLVLGLASEAIDRTAGTDPAERVVAGVRRDTLEWAVLFDDGSTEFNAARAALLGGTARVVSVVVGSATGSVGYGGTAYLLSARDPVNIGSMARIEAGFKPDGAWDQGHCAAFTLAGTGVGTVAGGTVDNTSTSTAGARFYVHLPAGTGTAALQHSTDGTVWSDITGMAVSVTSPPVGTLLALASGTTLNRRTRVVVVNGTGTVTAVLKRL